MYLNVPQLWIAPTFGDFIDKEPFLTAFNSVDIKTKVHAIF